MADLLQQLVRQLVDIGNPAIEAKFTDLYRQHQDTLNSRPSLDEISLLLRDIVDCFSKVHIVIDALDERAEDECGDVLLEEIRKLQQPKICLLATSRSLPIFETEQANVSELEIRATDEDISKYVAERTHRSKILTAYMNRDPTFEETIKSTVTRKANGM
jgi:hypothetical protein